MSIAMLAHVFTAMRAALQMAADPITWLPPSRIFDTAALSAPLDAGGDTDTTRDHVYTDWEELEVFARHFGRRVQIAAA